MYSFGDVKVLITNGVSPADYAHVPGIQKIKGREQDDGLTDFRAHAEAPERGRARHQGQVHRP